LWPVPGWTFTFMDVVSSQEWDISLLFKILLQSKRGYNIRFLALN